MVCSDLVDAGKAERESGFMQTIDEYIEAQPRDVRPLLQSIRDTIREAAPEATEKISWNMPTFWLGENIIHFAAHKSHIGLYPGPEAIVAFESRLR